jgi:hypothetical protein
LISFARETSMTKEQLLQAFDEEFFNLGLIDYIDGMPPVSADSKDKVKSFLLRAVEEAEQRGRDMAVEYVQDHTTLHTLNQEMFHEIYKILEEARSSRPTV